VIKMRGRTTLLLLGGIAAIAALAVASKRNSSPALSVAPSGSVTATAAQPVPPRTVLVEAASWPAPNRTFTPGKVVADCTYPRDPKQRDVTAQTRFLVMQAYGYHGPTDLQHVGLDHLVPFSLCGANSADNLWPEVADGVKQSTYIHNRKDQLEDAIASKVRYHRMTLAEGQAVFQGDWRAAWCHYVHAADVDCGGWK
jgi:hypothetical protein